MLEFVMATFSIHPVAQSLNTCLAGQAVGLGLSANDCIGLFVCLPQQLVGLSHVLYDWYSKGTALFTTATSATLVSAVRQAQIVRAY